MSLNEVKFLEEYLKENLVKGFIWESHSLISHGILFVPKKDGGLWPYINYRSINAITKRNQYPLPLINEL